MPVQKEQYQTIHQELSAANVQLVAVSKIQPPESILDLYELGQKDFGENYVQELVAKAAALPKDLRWHFIGHLQRNKVKMIAPIVHLIQGVDSYKLLEEINKEAKKNNRIIDCLLQVHIAQEDTKFGLDEIELDELIGAYHTASLEHVRITGLMGMASFSSDVEKVNAEFSQLKNLFDQYQSQPETRKSFTTLSMGMSGDYKMAIAAGSNLVRIGSLLFGARG